MVDLFMRAGIYQITNIKNGKRYIGSAKNVPARKNTHFSALRKGMHHNPHLQAAWGKYGEAAFSFCCLERCDVEYLLIREQHWLDMVTPEYNILRVAGRPIGHVVSEETRRKISERMKGIVHSEAVRKKIAATLRGRKVPREVVEKGARTRAGMKGWSPSPEQRSKISASLRGRKAGLRSLSTRLKIAAKATGRKHSQETKEKISRNRRGIGCGERPASVGAAIALAKAAMSEAQIRQIRLRCEAGEKQRDVAALFGISKTTVGQIARRQSYQWVLG